MENDDILRIHGSFIRGIITRVIKHTLKKKFGIDLDVDIYEIEVKKDPNESDKVRFNLKATGTMSQTDISKLVNEALSNG